VSVAAVLAGAPLAIAQAQQEDEALTEVTVTGSRIIREGMTSPTPVTSLSQDELLQNNPQSISQALATLPSMTGSTTPKSIGGRSTIGVGSFLNLRNLGTNRNLVLLDGRRLVPANIAGNTDINLLPQGLISNVSVVTGGASAAYGSDAVAGVTNFILDKRFEGFKADINGGLSSHGGDAESYRGALAWGAPFMDGRLHLIGSFDWRHSESGFQANRGWANQHCAVVPIPGVTTGNMSPTNPRQTVACGVTQPNAAYGGAIISGPLVTPGQGITFGANGEPLPFNYGTLRSNALQVGGDGNFIGDVLNFSTPMDNKVFFGHANLEVSDRVEAFLQTTFARADSQYNQTLPNFFGAEPISILSGNPFIPASIQERMTDLGVQSFALPIVSRSWGHIGLDSGYQAWDVVTGLQGKFGDTWRWDTYYERGRTTFRLDYRNNILLDRLYRAADAVVSPNGTVVCQSALVNPAAYGDCVPLNPFGANSASAAALDYIHGNGIQPRNYNIMRQQTVAANINGEPFSSWAGPIAVGAGVEWRELEGEILSDPISQSIAQYDAVRAVPDSVIGDVGGWATSNVQPTHGSYDVKEGFVEILVPLAKDAVLARSLDLNAAFRMTNYSQSGTVETWKAGLTWRPIDELLLRATRSRDIRAPGIGDLFTAASTAPRTIVIDPLNNNTSIAVTTAISGNPNLEPEEADTTTVGFTYQPAWLSGFGASFDYYDIRINDVLASVGAQETVDRCALGQQDYCANLDRTNGELTLIRLPTMNLSEQRTRGVDLDLSYRTELFGANTSFRLIGTRLLEQSTTVPNATGANYNDRVGDITAGYSKWVVGGSANVDLGTAGFNVNARYIGGGKRNTTYRPGDIDPRFAEIGSIVTVDVGARYRLETAGGAPELYVNVANVFDRDPPLLPSSQLVGFQTNSTLYDTIGRYYTAGVRISF